MGKKITLAAQRRSIRTLLNILRDKLADAVPIYIAEIKDLDTTDSDTISALARLIAGNHQSFVFWGGGVPYVAIVFGYAAILQKGLEQLEEIAEPFSKYMRVLYNGPIDEPDLSTPGKKQLFTASMIELMARIVRRAYPESPLQPNILRGQIIAAAIENYPGQRAIMIPEKVHQFAETAQIISWQSWQNLADALQRKEASITIFRTPLLLSLARICKLLLENLNKRLAIKLREQTEKESARTKSRLVLGGQDGLSMFGRAF